MYRYYVARDQSGLVLPHRRHFDTIKVVSMIIAEFKIFHVIINALQDRNDVIEEFHDCIYPLC